MSAEPERFAALFSKPNVEAMHALSPREFERFVAYVLRRAGYEVKEVGPHFLRGVDLEARAPGKNKIVAGIECKRYAPDQLVSAPVVRGVLGAPAVHGAETKPFVITTSDFNGPAHQMASAGRRHAYLMNGAQLVRYINYVRDSRNDDDDVIASISPEYFTGKDSIHPRRVGATRILTVANNKGGVGKTTTAYYLGAEFARRGKRVLLVDLDGQGNLTERCLPAKVARRQDVGEAFPNITHYFAHEQGLAELVTPTEIERMSIIPADPLLTLRDYGGHGRPGIELGFAHDLQTLCELPLASLGGPPDWIIIDTPPALSVFTRGGLAAAEYVIAPVRPRPASFAGTRNMLQTLRTVNALMGTEARLLGAVVTHWDDLQVSRTTLAATIEPAINNAGGTLLSPYIPMDNRLETLEPGAGANGARAYAELAEEVLRYAEQDS